MFQYIGTMICWVEVAWLHPKQKLVAWGEQPFGWHHLLHYKGGISQVFEQLRTESFTAYQDSRENGIGSKCLSAPR
jgi:hypothetical protein